jgi:MoxR-like ATPase
VALADLQRVSKPVLRHRLIRSFEGEADGITTDKILGDIIAQLPEQA